MGHDITQAEALLALIEPGALLELCTFAANAIRLDAGPILGSRRFSGGDRENPDILYRH